MKTEKTEKPKRTEQPSRARRRGWVNLVLALLLVGGGLFVLVQHPELAHANAAVPHSAAMEKRTGVRFSRAVVVGDGGLVTLSYVVIDPELATQFQADRDHPPRLTSEARPGGTQRASIMRAGHQMRAGQTYYLVYENTKGAIRAGEEISVSYGGIVLHHLPVP